MVPWRVIAGPRSKPFLFPTVTTVLRNHPHPPTREETIVSDLAKLIADLGEAGQKLAEKAHQIVTKTGMDAVAIAQSNAPVDTGFHRSGIGMDVTGVAEVEFGATSHYGPYLEFGTYKMAPRPHIHPAADAVIPGMEAALGQAAEQVLKP